MLPRLERLPPKYPARFARQITYQGGEAALPVRR
jgi:hypothetical protein